MFDRVVAMSANHPKQSTLPPFDIMVGYEFIPLQKVCSVSPDATGFRSRGPQPNIVMVISWDQEEEGEDVQHARGFAQELVKVIDATQERQLQEHENYEYGNYGVCIWLIGVPCEFHTRICQCPIRIHIHRQS
jgi:hypothetical protein